MADESKRPQGKRPGDGARGPRKPGGPAGRAGDKPAWKKRDSADGGKPAGDRKPWEKRDRKPGDKARGERKPWEKRDGKPGDKARGERKPWEKRDGKPGGKPWEKKGERSGDRADRPPRPREDDRPRHDDPLIPEDVAANQLDRAARAELKTLSKDNADWVAKHLVMAGRLIDTDPELAHRHALAAARRAGRIGVVRETSAITAYATGDFALALRELRTYRRITGRDDQLPLMVDSERGVGRPQQALELGRSVPRADLEPAVQVALAIAMSGARLDLGQPELALTELEIPQLDPDRAFSYSPALFDAYATVLEELGRGEEAAEWYARSERAAEALEEASVPEGQDTIEIVEEILDDEYDDVEIVELEDETAEGEPE
ncbi:hypothetical protein [Protaetiibacter sp. SSC-01]|uniref:hypothetical protein n=1 Tax=Protaetiibacter sp. SSC-01 TaxID=2759943 RepID=UPI001CA38FBD|nr:hypothetical protein [Protaetiibacter sp. SSC-01]